MNKIVPPPGVLNVHGFVTSGVDDEPSDGITVVRVENFKDDRTLAVEYNLTFYNLDPIVRDRVTVNEAAQLKEMCCCPADAETRRQWLDVLWLHRLLRIVPVRHRVLEAFVKCNMILGDYTESGEAVMAIVNAVPVTSLRLQEHATNVVLNHAYAKQANAMIEHWYSSEFPSFTTARREGAPSGGQDGQADEGETASGDVAEGAARKA